MQNINIFLFVHLLSLTSLNFEVKQGSHQSSSVNTVKI